jgi:hypothetical protein
VEADAVERLGARLVGVDPEDERALDRGELDGDRSGPLGQIVVLAGYAPAGSKVPWPATTALWS